MRAIYQGGRVFVPGIFAIRMTGLWYKSWVSGPANMQAGGL